MAAQDDFLQKLKEGDPDLYEHYIRAETELINETGNPQIPKEEVFARMQVNYPDAYHDEQTLQSRLARFSINASTGQKLTPEDTTAILQKAKDAGPLNPKEAAQQRIEDASAAGKANTVESKLEQAQQNGSAPLPGETQAMQDARERIEAVVTNERQERTTQKPPVEISSPADSLPETPPQTQQLNRSFLTIDSWQQQLAGHNAPTPAPLQPEGISPPPPPGPETIPFPQPPVPKKMSAGRRFMRRGLGALAAPFIGISLAGSLASNQTQSQKQYNRYYAPEELSRFSGQLGGLRNQTAEWYRLMGISEELPAVMSRGEAFFSGWRKEHPNIPSSAWEAYKAFEEYSAYFPEGAESEREFQEQFIEHQRYLGEKAKQEYQQKKAERQQLFLHLYSLPSVPILNRLFLSGNIDQDPGFRKTVEELREKFETDTGKKIEGKTYFKDKDGNYAISRRVLEAMPDIQQEANQQFRERKPKLAKKYDKQKRGYLTNLSSYDPNLREAYGKATRLANEEYKTLYQQYQSQKRVNPEAKQPVYNDIRDKHLEKGLKAFVKDHPGLTRAYRYHDVRVGTAIANYERSLPRLSSSDLVKAVKDEKLAEALREAGANAEKTWNGQWQLYPRAKYKELPEPSWDHILKHAIDSEMDKFVASDPQRTKQLAPYNSYVKEALIRKEQRDKDGERQLRAAKKEAATPSPRLSTETVAKRGAGRFFTFRRGEWGMPTPGAVRNGSQTQRTVAPPPANPSVSQTSSDGAVPGLNEARQLFRIAQYARFIWPTAAVLVIVIIIMFINMLNESDEGEAAAPGATEPSVQISTEAPEEVGNEESIVYTIRVAVTGTPDDVEVTYVIPDNTTLVEEPVPPPTRSDGKTLVWSLKMLQQGQTAEGGGFSPLEITQRLLPTLPTNEADGTYVRNEATAQIIPASQ